MQYPIDFPPESSAAVAAEKLRAGKDFDKARENPQRLQSGFEPYLEAELRKYILRPFGVFVREACKLGHKGIWHVDRIEKFAREFLRLSTIDAMWSKGWYRNGQEIGRGWIESGGSHIGPEVQRQFERSGEWQQFQDALLQVAEIQEARTSDLGEKTEKEIGTVTRDFGQSERTDGRSSEAENAAMPIPELTAATTDHGSDLSKMVDAFLLQCNRESPVGFKVIRKHIWLAAGHAHARQFQYWQENSKKATDEDDRNFRRILHMAPAEFIALLRKKSIALSNS
jgi:hypothetical protein